MNYKFNYTISINGKEFECGDVEQEARNRVKAAHMIFEKKLDEVYFDRMVLEYNGKRITFDKNN